MQCWTIQDLRPCSTASTLELMLEEGSLKDATIAKSDSEVREMWHRRECSAEIQLAKKPLVDADPALPLDKITEFLKTVGSDIEVVDPGSDRLWIAHLGDGNLHYSVALSSEDKSDAVLTAIEKVAIDLGGTFSAEHGIGRFMRKSLERWKDPVALEVMKSIKRTLDPKGLMNPGKVFVDD